MNNCIYEEAMDSVRKILDMKLDNYDAWKVYMFCEQIFIEAANSIVRDTSICSNNTTEKLRANLNLLAKYAKFMSEKNAEMYNFKLLLYKNV